MIGYQIKLPNTAVSRPLHYYHQIFPRIVLLRRASMSRSRRTHLLKNIFQQHYGPAPSSGSGGGTFLGINIQVHDQESSFSLTHTGTLFGVLSLLPGRTHFSKGLIYVGFPQIHQVTHIQIEHSNTGSPPIIAGQLDPPHYSDRPHLLEIGVSRLSSVKQFH